MSEEVEQAFDFNPRPPGMPLDLWGALVTAVGETAESAGYECYFKQDTGLGVVYVRKRPTRDDR